MDKAFNYAKGICSESAYPYTASTGIILNVLLLLKSQNISTFLMKI